VAQGQPPYVVNDLKVVVYEYDPTIKQHVIGGVGAIVRPAAGADMSTLRIGTRRCLDADATNLTRVVMKVLDPLRYSSVTDDPLNGRVSRPRLRSRR
jgi:hypothetical protein